jgi:hypothetical protein
MEFFAQATEWITPPVMGVGIFIIFLAMIFLVNNAAKAIKVPANVDWQALGDHLSHTIITIATTPQDREAAKALAAEYSVKLGRPIDWRMALVLKQGESYIENFAHVDVDLITLAYTAEGVYFEIKGELEGRVDTPEDEPEEEPIPTALAGL